MEKNQLTLSIIFIIIFLIAIVIWYYKTYFYSSHEKTLLTILEEVNYNDTSDSSQVLFVLSDLSKSKYGDYKERALDQVLNFNIVETPLLEPLVIFSLSRYYQASKSQDDWNKMRYTFDSLIERNKDLPGYFTSNGYYLYQNTLVATSFQYLSFNKPEYKDFSIKMADFTTSFKADGTYYKYIREDLTLTEYTSSLEVLDYLLYMQDTVGKKDEIFEEEMRLNLVKSEIIPKDLFSYYLVIDVFKDESESVDVFCRILNNELDQTTEVMDKIMLLASIIKYCD